MKKTYTKKENPYQHSFGVLLFILTINIFAGTPYFVSDTCRSTKIVFSQNIQFSFDTIPAIIDTIKDSAFSCANDSCVWTYTIKAIDTRVEQKFNFHYAVFDSCDYVDTLIFSFFDSENDSCKFVVAGIDTLGKRILADSIWGNIASKPGVGKRIFFSHRSPLTLVIPGIIEVSNPSDTVWDTICNNPVSIFNAISDSAFFERLQGAWRIYFSMQSYNGGFNGAYIDSNWGYFVNKNQVIAYKNGKATATIVVDNSYRRDGWEIQKPYSSDCYEPLLQLLLNEQQLLIISRNGCGAHGGSILRVCSRDTTIKSISNVIGNNYPHKSDIFELEIKLDPCKPFIAISFKLQESDPVHIGIFDISGRQIINRPGQVMNPGYHELRVDPKNLTNSIYLCKLKIADKIQTKPILLFK